MIATKEQERKALEKIRKIVDELGEGSYLAMAFEGCFEDAEENIANDAGCSWKQRAEHYLNEGVAEHQVVLQLQSDKEALALQLKASEDRAFALESHVPEVGDLETCIQLVSSAIDQSSLDMAANAEIIVANAEDPGSALFVDAVRMHRQAEKQCTRFLGLKERLEHLK